VHLQALRGLLSDLARERRFRKQVEALRVDQSERLLSAARARDAMLVERRLDVEGVMRTLLRWLSGGILQTRVLLRAPSGAMVNEYESVSDVPLDACDPSTGKWFRVCPEHVEVWYRVWPNRARVS
jgi:hypothetical protein